MHDRGHGRDEIRPIQVLPAPPGLFRHAARAFLIERTVRDPHGGQLRSAVAALGITSRTIERGRVPRMAVGAVAAVMSSCILIALAINAHLMTCPGRIRTIGRRGPGRVARLLGASPLVTLPWRLDGETPVTHGHGVSCG
jgi:hypothetical protein